MQLLHRKAHTMNWPAQKLPITIIILTFNEELNIADCLSSCTWSDDVQVLDSGSTDRTCEIAEEHGATVHHHPFSSFGEQRNWAIETPTIQTKPADAGFKTLDFLVPKNELRQNRGFETVTRAHARGQQEGELVVVSEKSLDKAGNIFAAIIEGPDKGIFTVKRSGEFDITDGAFLPDGDLLLLERSFSMSAGVKMRLRRIYGESVAKGSVADGPVLFEADMSYQIDNMEAMDVWTREDGAVMVSLMSDDNHSILQRNLYLEFVLHSD